MSEESRSRMKQPWIGRRISHRVGSWAKRVAYSVRCFVIGHNWIEVERSEYPGDGEAVCTECGKEISMIYKYTIGGKEYPLEDDEE